MIGLGLGAFESFSHLDDDPGWMGTGSLSSPGPRHSLSAASSSSTTTEEMYPSPAGIEIVENVLSFIDNFATTLIQEAPHKLKKTTQKLRDRLSREPQELLNRHVKRPVEELKARMNEPPVVALRDKISFFIGVNNVCLMVFLLAAYPHLMSTYYLIQSAVLLPLRFWLYYQRSWHYFTFDLCYFVNVLTLLYLFVYPDSTVLLSAAFALAHGPVIWAVVQWRNSLVFHSLDKVTSCFIHMTPCVALYCCRWGLKGHWTYARRFSACQRNLLGFTECWRWAMFYYLVWQLSYYVWVNLVKRKKVEAGERVTSFTYIVQQEEQRPKAFLWRMLNLLGPQGRLFMFMLAQFIYAGVTMVPIHLFWEFQSLHAALIYTMFAACVWNGSTYYIEVFSKSYAQSLHEIGHKVLEYYQDTNDNPSNGGSSANTSRASPNNGGGAEDSWDVGTTIIPPEHPTNNEAIDPIDAACLKRRN